MLPRKDRFIDQWLPSKFAFANSVRFVCAEYILLMRKIQKAMKIARVCSRSTENCDWKSRGAMNQFYSSISPQTAVQCEFIFARSMKALDLKILQVV